MTIRLTTLGGLRAFSDDAELDWLPAQRLRAALLVYLAVERRVSRASLLTVFWPERDEAHARQALRQGLYHLGRALGAAWIERHPHELRVGPHVHADVHAFEAALARGDAAAAARLYGGPFLAGVHLANVEPWETWVDVRRAACARAFRKACRRWLEAERAAGDLAGAIEAAQRWVAPDPLDDEAQHRLIEALADAGERAEAIRQYETYARLLEPDGLRPLDETVALLERVRAEAPAWPDRGPAPGASAPATPLEAARPAEPELAPEAAAAASSPDTAAPGLAATAAPPATARGLAAAVPRRPHAHPRRRRLARAGANALALAALLAGFWVLRPRPPAGPAGSLVAEGVLEPGEELVIADFGGPRADTALGAVVTDALRMDLLEAGVFRVLDPAEVREIRARMQVADGVPLDGALAREVALRAGAEAVLVGEIAQAGSGYVLTATLRSADSDRILAAFRETAHGEDEVVAAIDRLSRAIRRRAGETLRSLDAVAAPARVTTSSLDALRAYTRAVRAFAQRDRDGGIALLEEAVALDPEFGMAWRALGIWLDERDAPRKVEAVTRAYELRRRMTPRERWLAEAAYQTEVLRDDDAAIRAYRRVLEIAPDDPTALNNLALRHYWAGEHEAAAVLLERAVARPDAPVATHVNLIYARLAQGRIEQARAATDALARRYPDDVSAAGARFWIHLRQGDDGSAAAAMQALLARPGLSPTEQAWAHEYLALAALWRGRLARALAHWETAERVAREGGAPPAALRLRLRRAFAVAALADPDRGIEIVRRAGAEGMLDPLAVPDRSHHAQALVFGIAGRPDDVEAVMRAFEAEAPAELRDARRTRTDAARAFVHLHRGEAAEAVRILQAVRAAHPCRYCLAAPLGSALAEAGRLRNAAQEWEAALAWKDDVFDGLPLQVPRNLWILQRLPRLYEQLGDTARALEHYRRFAELWRDADPELRPSVRQAQARIAALEARGRERRLAGTDP